ncbi:LysR family transcriptional regulator [Marinobacter salarius]|uniref:LysR family transcriptional regulator n=1 Tax=Marinobacter salarius TaxID=1420917 RepID=UPI00273B97A8|nr:LysR family transcriptional regulator [Marinobacter salarius]MDP4532889.1 LysR family transcriptional regulator [Marinobacter salarius]
MDNLDWDNLRIFLAAARAQSTQGAAQKLKLNHSTVSRRIQRLEEEAGFQLFIRNSKGLVLTSTGHRLLEHVENLESTIASVESNVFRKNLTLSGEIRVGATEAFGTFFLAPHFARFCKLHPSTSVDLLPMPRNLNLTKREADLLVTIDRPSTNSFVTCQLTQYRLLPYASNEYLAKSAPITKLEDLSDHNTIDYVDDLIFSPQQVSFQEWLPSVTPAFRSTSVIAQAQAVQAGLGIAILPCFLANRIEGLSPVLQDDIDIVRTFWLVAPPERREIARVRALWQYIREVAEANSDFLMGQKNELTWL